MHVVVLTFIALIVMLVMIICVMLFFEGKKEAAKWLEISRSLSCVFCGERYNGWNGDSWGCDANPPEFSAYGNVLRCPHCLKEGYILQVGNAYFAYDTIDAAIDASHQLTSETKTKCDSAVSQ